MKLDPWEYSSDLVPETGEVDIESVIAAAEMVKEMPTYRSWMTLLQFVGAAAEHFAWESYPGFDASESQIIDGAVIASEYLLHLEKGGG